MIFLFRFFILTLKLRSQSEIFSCLILKSERLETGTCLTQINVLSWILIKVRLFYFEVTMSHFWESWSFYPFCQKSIIKISWFCYSSKAHILYLVGKICLWKKAWSSLITRPSFLRLFRHILKSITYESHEIMIPQTGCRKLPKIPKQLCRFLMLYYWLPYVSRAGHALKTFVGRKSSVLSAI